MKRAILLIIAVNLFITSCTHHAKHIDEEIVTLDAVLSSHDIWYIDYNSKTGSGNVPFLSIGFTISFLQGDVYANNNLVNIGKTGNGYGVLTGSYSAYENILEIQHKKYGEYRLEVVQLSNHKIRLIDRVHNATYDLEGYQKNDFNFESVFYDNIEYFLQEYIAWGKIHTSEEGSKNPFDNETFLGFTSENNATFHSSRDAFGTNLNLINWEYKGGYEVADIDNYPNLKLLTLSYSNQEKEKFEVSILNHTTISLFHISSKTTYKFKGIELVHYLRPEKGSTNDKKEKTRFKTHRKTVQKKSL